MSETSSEKEPLRAKSPLRLLQVEHEQDDVERGARAGRCGALPS